MISESEEETAVWVTEYLRISKWLWQVVLLNRAYNGAIAYRNLNRLLLMKICYLVQAAVK